ncbi:hypothetical protein VTO73DRAFT_8317 [Trametes versicolor]
MTPNWSLDAWKYLPSGHGKQKPPQGWPVIVMAHGICSNKLMGLEPYAEVFASLGYAVVIFDYRRWGSSAGTPRHIIYVSEQLDDYRAVIKHCRQQSEIDPQKKKLNIYAAIAQCPYLGTGPPTKLTWTFVKTMWKCLQDVVRQAFGLSPKYIPAAAQPGEVGYMNLPGAKDGLFALVQDERDFPNEVSASSLFELPFYNPNASGAQITCRVLVIALEHDTLCPLRAATELQALSPRVQLVRIPSGHFDVYPGCPHYERSLDTMKAFLLDDDLTV